MEKIKENVLKAMRLLIETSRHMQGVVKESEKRNPRYFTKPENRLAFLKEFCTIRVCSSRRGGHSTSIVQCAVEDFHNPLILCYSENQSNNMKKSIKEIYPNLSISKYDKIICEHLNSKRMLGIPKVDAIFIDTASFISSSKMSEVYALAQGYCQNDLIDFPFFVILVE